MSRTYAVGYFVGSLSSTSINRVLSKALIALAPDDLEFIELPIGNLPLYSPDYDADYPPEARALKEAIAGMDAVLRAADGVAGRLPERCEPRIRSTTSAVCPASNVGSVSSTKRCVAARVDEHVAGTGGGDQRAGVVRPVGAEELVVGVAVHLQGDTAGESPKSSRLVADSRKPPRGHPAGTARAGGSTRHP